MTFHPYIFIETGFQRTGQPVWMLAVMESERRMPVPSVIIRLPLDQQIPVIQSIVVQHYEATGGQVEFWGRVERYRYLFAGHESIVFAPDGTVLGKGGGPSSEATLTINGKDVTSVIS